VLSLQLAFEYPTNSGEKHLELTSTTIRPMFLSRSTVMLMAARISGPLTVYAVLRMIRNTGKRASFLSVLIVAGACHCDYFERAWWTDTTPHVAAIFQCCGRILWRAE
jgi:hypothetical protein